MDLPSTLVEALERVADREDAGNSHLDLDAREPVDVSYAELHRRARRFAAALQEAGLARGSRLGLVLPDSADFVTAFYGSLVAGVVPVPVYPPIQLAAFDAYLETTSHVFARAGCPLVLTDARVRPILGRLLETVPGLRSIETFEKLVSRVPEDAAPAPVDVRPGDLAFLQFTSGSTARPKGVALTHENLLANIRAIGGPTGLRITRESSAVSWLPLYHDMGLIGFVLTPLVYETRGVLFVAPLAFLKRPAIWLRQLSSRRASITFAPNFAYGLCTKRIQPRDLEGLDLSSLAVAGCGAEPIQHETLQAFADRFAPVGFRRSAFLPCYGLAEHSLAATMTRLEDDLAFEDLDPAALAEGRAEPAAPGAIASVRLVDCGFPPPGHRLRIAGEDGSPCPDRVVGEIHLAGPSVMRGYWEDEEATAGALDREWLRTGDLGYTVGGRLFVCGRIKDLLIVHGRNYHPQDLERHAGEVDGLRKGNVVAFGVLDPAAGTERVVVAAEGRSDAADAERIASDVKTRLHERTGLGVDEVLVLPPGSLPKTSSGKLQRNKTRERYLDGTLARKPGSTRWRILRELARSRWSYLKSSIRDLGSREP